MKFGRLNDFEKRLKEIKELPLRALPLFVKEPPILMVLDDPAGLDKCAKMGLRPSIGLRRTYANSRRCAESDIVNGNDEFPKMPEGSMVILVE